LIVIGFAAGTIEKVAMNRVLLKNCSILGLYWGAYARYEKEAIPRVWNGLLHLFRQGRIRPVVYHKVYYGLDSVRDGLKALANRTTYGKVFVVPNKGENKI